MHICVVTTNVSLQAALPWLLPNTEFEFADPDGEPVEACDAVVLDLGTTDSALEWLTRSTTGPAPGTPTIVVGDTEPSGVTPAQAEVVLRPVDLEDLRTRLERHRPAAEQLPEPEPDAPSGLGKLWRRVGLGGRTPEPAPTPDRARVDGGAEPPRPEAPVLEDAAVRQDGSTQREPDVSSDGGEEPDVVPDQDLAVPEEVGSADGSSRPGERRARPTHPAAEPQAPSTGGAGGEARDASRPTAEDGLTDRAPRRREPAQEPDVGAGPAAESGMASSRSIPRPPAETAIEPETTPGAPTEPDVGDVEHGPEDVQASSDLHTEPPSTAGPEADEGAVGEEPLGPSTSDHVDEAAGSGRPPSQGLARAGEGVQGAPLAPPDQEPAGRDRGAGPRAPAESRPAPVDGFERRPTTTRPPITARLNQWRRRGLARLRRAKERLDERVSPSVRQSSPGSVPRLAQHIDQLPALADPAAVAAALAAELHDRGAADAVAVLLRSPDGYRAIGGARLTSAQQRAFLPLDHPLAELLATRTGGMLLLEGQHGGTALVRGVPVAHEDVTTVIPLHDDDGLLAITVIGGLGGRPPALIGAVEEAREFLQLLTWLEAEGRH